MDANLHVEKQQVLVRKLVGERIDLKKFKRRSPLPLPPSAPHDDKATEVEEIPPHEYQSRIQNKCRHFYGHGIPGVRLEDITGKLIVVEGADGSGAPRKLRGWWTVWKPAARHGAGRFETLHARKFRA